MPEVEITIGGRSFEVACQEGEEQYLQAAARMLDAEASVLVDQIGRVPEARMLLMAGLMLADKTAGLEDRLREAEDRAAGMEDQIRAILAKGNAFGGSRLRREWANFQLRSAHSIDFVFHIE